MNLKSFILAGALASVAAVPSVKAEEPLFMRSSIYSILINSDDQSKRLDEEAKKVDPEGYAKTLEEVQKQKISSLGAIPKFIFPHVGIPEQFNDHNLANRVIDFDKIAANITDEQAKEGRPKGFGGNMGKALAGAALAGAAGQEESSMVREEPVDLKMHAVVKKYFEENKVPSNMVAKWYSYNEAGTPKFSESLILERGLANASAEDLAKAEANSDFKAQLSANGFELLNNTYVVATNLRFRNNKAVADEVGNMVGGMAAAAGSKAGALGGLAAMGAKKGAQAAMDKILRDQYSVTAVALLYKLKWNDDIDMELSEKVLYNDKATLDDLLKSGLCELEYVGHTKARSGVKKDKEKSLVELTGTATVRAMDMAFAKLQVENEAFRTKVPVSKSEDGYVYAKIGTKEGVAKGDEYELLEMQLDPQTKRQVYKKIATAKVDDEKAIWFNTVGANELIAEADGKEAEAMKAAADLGYTKFKVGKKNDYSGYYLRLAKKKGEIKDN